MRWAVVGGGMLGMTLALRLRQRGHEVVLFEGASQLGGLASAWSLGDVVWDRHYHVILRSDRRLLALLRELGVASEIDWNPTQTGFFTDGRLYSMSSSLEFLLFPPLDIVSKLRLGATIFYASKLKDWRPLEQVPVGEWLEKLSGSRTFERIWRPLLRAKLGDSWEDASAAFIWAIIARMFKARDTAQRSEEFGTVRGGYARILGRFGEILEEQGVEVRLGSRVQRTGRAARGGVEVLSGPEPEHFDRAVLTMPAPACSRLVPELHERERALLDGVQYQGIVCCSLLLKKPLATYYITNITEEWVPFTAVIEMTALVDPAHFGGRTLVYLPKYVAPDDPLFDEDDASIRERFVGALERMYEHFRPADLLAFQVSRVRRVFPVSTLGFSRRVPSTETSIEGLYSVSSAQILNGTVNVNETVQLAERAMARLV